MDARQILADQINKVYFYEGDWEEEGLWIKGQYLDLIDFKILYLCTHSWVCGSEDFPVLLQGMEIE